MCPARFRVLSAVFVALTLAAAVRTTAQTPKGDLWETTSQMSTEGMPMAMPAQTMKVCSAKEWKQPPGGQKNCTSTNMKIVANKITWEVKCTGPTMNGVGEINRDGASAYTGSIKFMSDQGNMTVKLSGRKIGDCDNPQ
jgi:Protein of unknown function (DUF3617)